MIKALIFSKDRSLQLDALMRSFKLNCPHLFQTIVVYKVSTPEFLVGYNTLMAKWPNVEFIPEQHLHTDFIEVLHNNQQSLISLFTDDCIFYRKFDYTAENIQTMMDENKLVTFSFRLGYNTIVQNYYTGQIQPKLDIYNPKKINNDFVKWKYVSCHHLLNYGYVLSYDGHVYNGQDLYKMLLTFETLPCLRDFESALSNPKHRDRFPKNKDWIGCPTESCVVNIPVNNSQESTIFNGAKQRYSLEELNNKYINNEILDIANMDFSQVAGCHQEIQYKFKEDK